VGTKVDSMEGTLVGLWLGRRSVGRVVIGGADSSVSLLVGLSVG